METKTLLNVKNLLVASNYHFLDGDTAFQMFAEDVRKFSDSEVMSGAKNFIRKPGNYPNYPGLLDAIRTEHNARILYGSDYKPSDWNKAVRCLKCNDNGYIFRYWKKDLGDGCFQYTQTMKPCPCSIGRARFPSLFMSQAQRDAWAMEKARKGECPPKEIYDYTEEQFREAVGEEISESQYDLEFGKTLLRKAQLPKPETDIDDLWKEIANAVG